MATLEQRIIDLAQAIGSDVKTLNSTVGVLTNLTTTQKTNLVAAINELQNQVSTLDLDSLIDDAAGVGDIDVTYSADKIITLLDALKTDILGGIPPSTLDTLQELADYLTDNQVAGGLVEQLSQRVRVDAAQNFNAAQQTQARDNIGAAAASALNAFITALGELDHDFVADYSAAKA
jgi:hypothetical protein